MIVFVFTRLLSAPPSIAYAASVHGVPTNPINVAFPSTSCRSDDNIFLKNGNDWSGSSIVLQMAVETMNIVSQSATYSFWGFVQPSGPADQNRNLEHNL